MGRGVRKNRSSIGPLGLRLRNATASSVAARITPEVIASFSENLSRRLAEEPGLREELNAPTWAQPADRATRRYRKRVDRPLRREGR